MSYIYIVPIELADHSDLDALERHLSETFRRRTRRRRMAIDLGEAYDPNRAQYNSSLILRQIITSPPPDAEKILAVLDVDLCIPILTFVFGEAQLQGIGAVVSTHRLHNRFYGLPEDRARTTERLLKEAVHELGHTFGLIHCRPARCVMNASTYVENIDQKPVEFCPVCREAIDAPQRERVRRHRLFSWWGGRR